MYFELDMNVEMCTYIIIFMLMNSYTVYYSLEKYYSKLEHIPYVTTPRLTLAQHIKVSQLE